MNIADMSLVECKSLAYDELLKAEIAQNNLRLINAEIQKRAKEVTSEPVA